MFFFIHVINYTQNFDVNYEIASRYPLHYAADYGQTSVLDYLLSKGAKVDVRKSSY